MPTYGERAGFVPLEFSVVASSGMVLAPNLKIRIKRRAVPVPHEIASVINSLSSSGPSGTVLGLLTYRPNRANAFAVAATVGLR